MFTPKSLATPVLHILFVVCSTVLCQSQENPPALLKSEDPFNGASKNSLEVPFGKPETPQEVGFAFPSRTTRMANVDSICPDVKCTGRCKPKLTWYDSYQVNGRCHCRYENGGQDHDIRDLLVCTARALIFKKYSLRGLSFGILWSLREESAVPRSQ
jgi:hypothetical protein